MSTTSPTTAPTGREALRRIRVEAVCSTLLAESPLSRTDLARHTGYSQSAVTGIVQELIEAGYVREAGQTESTGGRRSTLIELDRAALTVAVVGLRGETVWAALIDLTAAEVARVERPFNAALPVESTIECLSELLAGAAIPPTHIVVSVSGVVAADGSLSLAPAFARAPGVRLAAAIEERVGIHTTVENDVNLIAHGERIAGAGIGQDDLVLVHIGEGLGATIIIGGRVLAGATRSAGEIGFLPEDLDGAEHGDRGEFEKRWSTPGLLENAARAGIKLDPERVIADLCAREDAASAALLDDAVRAWAFAAVVCICVVNPGSVIFSGEAGDLGDAARATLRRRVDAGAPSPTQVSFASLGNASILHGAIATVLADPVVLFSALAE
ncbi:ROK family transcriptional regulator [Mycetocola spongiae]|uniref:ROK family transcriptional regulator n=1 Tax=Mycetocola spongiae TaxID=2859226 RepID=UPI001CF3DE47|nr:ROK family transcriptional regulator [Mycetocola spongiae]UCR89812.1 ROK family transcriptional regulator [Mycetocola spongiae]